MKSKSLKSKRLKSAGMIALMLSIMLSLFAFLKQPAWAYETGDDYPWKGQSMDEYDDYLFYKRNCTSFVAWCLNSRNGVEFTNWYGGVRWGGAFNWGNAARQLGIAVDNNPAIGSVAWMSSGHVAWVRGVDGDNVTVDEYNWNDDGLYHYYTWPKSHYSGFIHIKDIGSSLTGVLDINGTVDGAYQWSLEGFATFDVYINGSLQKDDEPDYCAEFPSGTRYEIRDIKAKDGYSYVGVQGADLSGTIGSGETTVELKFVSTGVLDINGTVDGTYKWSLDEFVTFDVYINDSLQLDDVSDYCADLPSGARYEIRDIKAKDGYSYEGAQGADLSGTIGSGTTTTVELKFVTICRLDVNGMLDGTFSGGLGNYGTFDVYIGGEKVADDVNDYFNIVNKDSNYQITDIKATDGHEFGDVVKGSLTGTVGAGTKEVVLDFYTLGIPTGDWTYCDVLPRNITSDYCDIEYNNIYEKIAESSPGSGWTNEGVAREEWVNVGDVYVRNTDLETSDTRILVSSNYYHFCGPNAGDVGNYEQTGNYVHYDSIDASRVTATYLGDDNGHPYYFVYLDGNQLWCQSGVTCDGSYGTHGRRCRAWYKENRYQDRRKVTYYKFRKESDWTTSKDTSATTVKYRYRLKDTQMPVISSVKVTKITPDGYTIVCKASDDTGVVKLAASSWTDTETEAAVKVNEAVPNIVSGEVEITVTIPISEHSNEKDVNYNTKVTVYDKVGKATEYTEKDIKVYIPMLVRSPKKLDLPKGLKEIEDEAFEGSIGFGEVIIPDGTVKIGSKAFANCSRLVFISIPESVTEIADDALDGCGNAVILCGIDSKAAEFAVKNGIPYITSIFDE